MHAREGNVPTLDGWRAVAITMVIASHSIPPGSEWGWLRLVGVHGVFVFFVISGFIITTQLLREEERTHRVDLGAFYVRRAFRILPPALVYLGVVALLSVVGVLAFPVTMRNLLTAVAFLQNYVAHSPTTTPYTEHFWSLAVEEHFYVFYPALFLGLGSRRLRPTSLVLCAIVAIWRIVETRQGFLTRLLPDVQVGLRTDQLFDLLLFGGALACWLRVEAVRQTLARVMRGPVWLALAMALGWLIFQPPPLARTLEGLGVSLLLAGTLLHPQGWVGRFLEWAPVQGLGRISYSVYLWQQLFFVASFRSPAWPQRFPLNVALVLMCAGASYLFVEQPLRRIARGWLAAHAG